jgi:hypothetical protein
MPIVASSGLLFVIGQRRQPLMSHRTLVRFHRLQSPLQELLKAVQVAVHRGG